MSPIKPSISAVVLRTQSDERLVQQAQRGHERAFEVIFDRYRAELSRALRRFLPQDRIEDVLQQAFISAWTALGKGAEVRDLRPWLHRIARNAALQDLKRPGYDHSELHDALEFGQQSEDVIVQRDIIRRTLQGVASLPDRQREALLAIAVEGRPSREVADELGMSDPATRQMVSRARATLRAAVTAVTPPPLLGWALTAGHAAAAGEGVAGTALGTGGVAVVLKATAALTAGALVATAPVAIHKEHQRKHVAAALAQVGPGGVNAAGLVPGAAGPGAGPAGASAGTTPATGGSAAAATAAAAARAAHGKDKDARAVRAHSGGSILPARQGATTTTTSTTPAAATTTTTAAPTKAPVSGKDALRQAILKAIAQQQARRQAAAASGQTTPSHTSAGSSSGGGHHGSGSGSGHHGGGQTTTSSTTTTAPSQTTTSSTTTTSTQTTPDDSGTTPTQTDTTPSSTTPSSTTPGGNDQAPPPGDGG